MGYFESIAAGTATSGTGGTSESAKSSSATADIMGKQDFLSLLVAQLKNQDPLNPDEPTEFTAQLAQFSSLEQLFNLNESMETLAASNANADQFATLQTIGKNVAYHGSTFEYGGEGDVQLGYQLDGDVADARINIKKNGSTVAVLDANQLDAGNHFLSWDGLTGEGTPAGAGSYSFSIAVDTARGQSVAASPLVKSEVTGVDLSGKDGGILETRAGEIGFGSILGVYEI
ncbi:MAG: flagellar hook assembly protein FlgD [Desulfopila sp.]